MAVGEAQGSKAAVKKLTYEVSPGPGGLLTVAQTTADGETKRFIYQMADILGRIEITE